MATKKSENKNTNKEVSPSEAKSLNDQGAEKNNNDSATASTSEDSVDSGSSKPASSKPASSKSSNSKYAKKSTKSGAKASTESKSSKKSTGAKSKTTKTSKTKAGTGGSKKKSDTVFSADQFFSTPQSAAQNLTQTMETFMTDPHQIDQFSKDTVKAFKDGSEAFAKSSSLAMKGFEDYLKTITDLLKDSTEKHTNAYKELLQCKTLNELTEAQSALVQKAMDDSIKGATQLSELSVKICTESIEPLNEHVTKTYRQATSKLAA